MFSQRKQIFTTDIEKYICTENEKFASANQNEKSTQRLFSQLYLFTLFL